MYAMLEGATAFHEPTETGTLGHARLLIHLNLKTEVMTISSRLFGCGRS